jgi:hypothetical protein
MLSQPRLLTVPIGPHCIADFLMIAPRESLLRTSRHTECVQEPSYPFSRIAWKRSGRGSRANRRAARLDSDHLVSPCGCLCHTLASPAKAHTIRFRRQSFRLHSANALLKWALREESDWVAATWRRAEPFVCGTFLVFDRSWEDRARRCRNPFVSGKFPAFVEGYRRR